MQHLVFCFLTIYGIVGKSCYFYLSYQKLRNQFLKITLKEKFLFLFNLHVLIGSFTWNTTRRSEIMFVCIIQMISYIYIYF